MECLLSLGILGLIEDIFIEKRNLKQSILFFCLLGLEQENFQKALESAVRVYTFLCHLYVVFWGPGEGMRRVAAWWAFFILYLRGSQYQKKKLGSVLV